MSELIGFVLPPIIDLINRKIADKVIRFWVSILVCSVVGLFVHIVKNQMIVGYEDLSKDIMYIFGIAQISYNGLWSNHMMLGEIRDELGLNAKFKK